MRKITGRELSVGLPDPIAAAPSTTSISSQDFWPAASAASGFKARAPTCSNGKRHRYYSHRTKCPEGGLDRIGAEMTQELVLAWLRDVASNCERFRELAAQGRKRIAHHIAEIRESFRILEAERAAIEERVEARIQELTKTRTEAARGSIEKSILDLRQRKKALEEKQTFVTAYIRQADSILKSQEDQFTRYSRWTRKVLDQTGEGFKLGIHGLISRLPLMDSEMKLALSGANMKEPVRAAFAFAPPGRTRLPLAAVLAARSRPPRSLARDILSRFRR